MTWELRGFAENGTILFRLSGHLASFVGNTSTFFFDEAPAFADGVLSRISLTEGESIYFAGHLSALPEDSATVAYHHGDKAIPQTALNSIIKKGDVISSCLVVELKGSVSMVDMAWVNNLPHGTLIGDIHGDLQRMAKAFGLMLPYWKSILPSVKQDQVTGGHLDEMLTTKITTWELGLPYYGCLAWLFAHLSETRTFNTEMHRFALNDDYSLTVQFSPVLLQKHQPSRN